MKVLDLFCGMGGLALGFSERGFHVTGVDMNRTALETFNHNGLGLAVRKDLSSEYVDGDFDVIVGGPPCRPWSYLNVKKREEKHPDAILLDRFFEHVAELRPRVFIFENVPAIEKYMRLHHWIERIKRSGYSLRWRTISYSDWGAATGRKRFILTGMFRRYGSADRIWKLVVRKKRKSPSTVREAIGWLSNREAGSFPDHEWPNFRTVHRYMDKYRSGRYGWYILSWDRPAPSFGNVMKTYILHPASANGGPVRVISVREALSIMGFPAAFRFPEGTGLTSRYQMVADAVSPVFSRILAEAVERILS